MCRALQNAAQPAILLLSLCVLVFDSSNALALTLTWTHLGSGNFNDPGNWFGGGGTHVPDANDFVSFEIAAAFGAPYTVTFPGSPIEIGPGSGAGAADASYATAFLRVRDHGVTFDGSTQFGIGPSTYTIVSTTQSEANRGIIIGETPGENALLNVSHTSLACCGGLTTFSGVAATIGDAAGAAGTLNMNFGTFNVTGSDFTQTQLIVGNNGNGTLNVNNGADVNVTGFNSTVSLGHHASGVGTVSINGSGSTWTNDDQLWIGESGTGTLTVQNGGTLMTSSGAGGSNIIGVFGGSNGMVTITGPGSTWNNSNGLTVGNSGNGTLLIANGGSFTNTGTSLGGGFAASGTAAVTGAGSTWTDSGSTNVGSTGAGALTIQNGGNLTSGTALIRGLNSGSGQVLVAGAGSTWTVTTGPLTIGLPEGGFTTGPTTLTIIPGGTVNVAHAINLDANSTLNFLGGTLSAAEIGLNGLQFLGQFQWTAGTLHVGIFRKSLTNQGGILAPGHSAGRTTIDGNYIQQAAGAMEIQIGGTVAGTQYDDVDISGFATLGGELQLSLINGFIPTAAQTFTVLDSSSITGAFSNVANGQRIGVGDGSGSFLVNYGSGSAFDHTQVTLSGFQVVALPGDYNHNGIVDAADYTVWRDSLGHTGSGLAADGNLNNKIDAGDYDVWKTHFGTHAGSGTGAAAEVPEPATSMLLMWAAVGWCLSALGLTLGGRSGG
jgi:T5SS/PEP-CTERM-associated repeat protein